MYTPTNEQQMLMLHGVVQLLIERLDDTGLVVRVGAAGALRYGFPCAPGTRPPNTAKLTQPLCPHPLRQTAHRNLAGAGGDPLCRKYLQLGLLSKASAMLAEVVPTRTLTVRPSPR